MTTELHINTPSAVCSLGMRPLLMTGFLVQWVRQHFADQQNIEDQHFRNPPAGTTDFLWRPNNDSGIVIESATKWDPALTGKRPAILIKRNSWGSSRSGINDQHMGQLATDGRRYFTHFVRGSHTLFCVAGEPAEAEKLGYEIYRDLGQYAMVIRQSLGLQRFQILKAGSVGKLKEATDNFAVPVSVGYAFEESWTVRQHAPILKRIDLATAAQGMD